MAQSGRGKKSDHESKLQDFLLDWVRKEWASFIEAASKSAVTIPEPSLLYDRVEMIWAFSEFISRSCIRNPSILIDLLDSEGIDHVYGPDVFTTKVTLALSGVRDEQELGAALRKLRLREMIRIAWRDLSGEAGLEEIIADLSRLAEACIEGALNILYAWQAQEMGVPCNGRGVPQKLVVIGMGKLGASELNFSSDVDLIFAFPESGETEGGPTSVSNDQFFTRLARRLIKALAAKTNDGFVFRVDMNLRPFGDNGPLVMSFESMEDYYESQGREWERYAWIKARTVAGDMQAGHYLLDRLRPFVFRRYLDFTVFKSLRDMKDLLEREIIRRNLADNVKLGPGGIREIEFIVQTFQLLCGGRIPELRNQSLLRIVELLPAHKLLSIDDCCILKEAYVFLRTTEHRLQEYADQQTHDMPKETANRLRLALSMGLPDWESFRQQAVAHMKGVHDIFKRIMAQSQMETTERSVLQDLAILWKGVLDQEHGIKLASSLGFDKPDEALRLLDGFRNSRATLALSSDGRNHLDRLLPLLLSDADGSTRTVVTLKRLLLIIESIQRRTCYVALLEEKPEIRSRLILLCSESSWITQLISRHPILLDELISNRKLDIVPDRLGLQQELRERLARVSPPDLEQQMDELRTFKHAQVLHVAAADLADNLPLMKVSDHLTEIAEMVLKEVLDLAWDHLCEKHGPPVCAIDGTRCELGFAVVAYGKFGGIELGYGSDLDLVFLHAGNPGDVTGGPNPVEYPVFFMRLGQRIIHILTANTSSGILYPVDMRLRPSGESGVLVCHVDGFAEYQSAYARTWEHQSLIRARIVAGDPLVGKSFDEIREKTLARPRDPGTLRVEVRSMRERMRKELGLADPDFFDLKQDPGGIVDIEFMVQYQVLAGARDHPGLLRWTDNVRLLEEIEQAGLIGTANAAVLKSAFLTYRKRVHKLSLDEQPARVSVDEYQDLRKDIIGMWEEMIG